MKFRITARDETGYPVGNPLIADEDADTDGPESIDNLYNLASEMYSAGTVFDLPVGGTVEIERIA